MRASIEFPLLKRELVGLLRTKRAFWLLVSTIIISSLVPLLTWPGFWASGAQDPQQNAMRFSGFVITQLIVSLLITPAFASAAFTAEREGGTFELVYSTLLSPFSIVFSKFFSSIGYLLLLLVTSAPAVCALYLLGGFGFAAIIKSYAITVAALVSSCLVCLTISLRSAGTAQALVRSFVWILVWNGGLALFGGLLLVIAFQAGFAGSEQLLLPPLLGLSPISVLFVEARALGGPMPFHDLWVIYLGYSGLLALGHLAYLLRKARNPYAVFQPRRKRVRRHRGRSERRRAQRSILSRLLLALGREEVPGFANPVFQKDLKSEFFSRVLYRRTVFWTSLLVYALLAVALHDSWRLGWLHFIANLNMFLIVLLVPAVAATSITKEREKGNLDFLRSSLLSMGTLLRGKFFSAIYSNFGMFAAMVWVTVVAAFVLRGAPTRSAITLPAAIWTVIVAIAVTLFTYAFVAALGLLASVWARRSVNALLLTYGALLFICIGLPVLYAFFDFGALDDQFAMATHPFAVLNVAIEGLASGRGYAGAKVYEMLGYFIFMYGLGTAALLYLAVRTGDVRLSRDA